MKKLVIGLIAASFSSGVAAQRVNSEIDSFGSVFSFIVDVDLNRRVPDGVPPFEYDSAIAAAESLSGWAGQIAIDATTCDGYSHLQQSAINLAHAADGFASILSDAPDYRAARSQFGFVREAFLQLRRDINMSWRANNNSQIHQDWGNVAAAFHSLSQMVCHEEFRNNDGVIVMQLRPVIVHQAPAVVYVQPFWNGRIIHRGRRHHPRPLHHDTRRHFHDRQPPHHGGPHVRGPRDDRPHDGHGRSVDRPHVREPRYDRPHDPGVRDNRPHGRGQRDDDGPRRRGPRAEGRHGRGQRQLGSQSQP